MKRRLLPLCAERERAVAAMVWIAALFLFVRVAADDQEQGAAKKVPLARPVTMEQLQNTYQLTPKLICGSRPESAKAFAELKKLGVAHIISVDAGRPDLKAAAEAGIQYIHVPVGYAGISKAELAKIIKGVKSAKGIVYIHCHHGKHRGPTAAGLVCQSLEHWSREQAVAWMEEAGTSPAYAGLFRTARELPLPTDAEIDAAKIESVATDVPTLAARMAQLEAPFDRIRESEKWGFQPGTWTPERTLAEESLLLLEQLKELQAAEENSRAPKTFTTRLKESVVLAAELHRHLDEHTTAPTPGSRFVVGRAFSALSRSCTACHVKFRDAAPEN